jgi:hypothetical protein
MKDGNILLKTQQASYYTDQLIVLMFLHIYHLFFQEIDGVYFGFLSILCAAKRLSQVQPAPNPSGMVIMDRPTERTASAACCS